jgi:tetratricopeptide (TPR) repeat protein
MSQIVIFTPRTADPGGLLRSSRQRSGLGHDEFASLLGRLIGRAELGPGVIRAWERGVTRPPPEILKAAQQIAVQAGHPGTSLRPSPVTPTAAAVTPTSVGDHSSIEFAMQTFRDADRQVGGGYVYGGVLRYLERDIAPRLFRGTVSLFCAAAALTEMAGWMAHDAGDDMLARQHFDRALQFASATDDRHLAAHVHASLSHLAQQTGNPRDSLQLARAGRSILRHCSHHPPVLARLYAMEARALASLRRRVDRGRALMTAERALDQTRAEGPSPWVSPFDHASLAAEASQCMQQLGQLAAARHHSEQVIRLRDNNHARSRAFGQLRLAAILVSQGEVDHACTVSQAALASTDRLSSSRVTQLMSSLYEQLQPHASQPDVQHITHSLSAALSTRAHTRILLTAGGNAEI